MILSEIKKNFNVAAPFYDDVAFVQKACAEKLVTLLLKNIQDFCPNILLDVGTGTGYIPELLCKKFPVSHYTLNDIASAMLEKARERLKHPQNLDILLGDMETIKLKHYDLITSNLALQWSKDIYKTIHRLYDHTHVLAFSCLLHGTFREWSELFQKHSLPSPTHAYPTKEELQGQLKVLGASSYFFEIFETTIHFKNIRAFINYLKKLGANTPPQKIPSFGLKILMREEPFSATYKVFLAVLEKNPKN